MTNSKQKGNQGEREAAELWRTAGFSDARRRLLREEARDPDGIDLEATPGWAVQVKYAKRLTPLTALREVKAPDGASPIVMLRQAGSRLPARWAVCLWWEDFEKILVGDPQ